MEHEFLGNPLRDWAAAGGTAAGIIVIFLLVKKLVFDRLRKVISQFPSRMTEIVDIMDQFREPDGAMLALWAGSRELILPEVAHRWIRVAVLLLVTYRIVKILEDIAAILVRRLVVGDDHADLARADTIRNINLLNNAVIWVGAGLFLLGSFGINVATIVAGLGITGVAVALAAQAILSDLFSAVSIYMDKPFGVGDFIMIDAFQGTVEHIGIKTTRVRSLSGEMLIFPNSMLTSSKVRNFKQMKTRRIVFDFGVPLRTEVDKIKKVVELAKEIVNKTGQVRLERAHFKGIDADSLDFEVVYHVLDSDYNVYMDANQTIHLGLVAALRKEGIDLAYPTHVMIAMPPTPNA